MTLAINFLNRECLCYKSQLSGAPKRAGRDAELCSWMQSSDHLSGRGIVSSIRSLLLSCLRWMLILLFHICRGVGTLVFVPNSDMLHRFSQFLLRISLMLSIHLYLDILLAPQRVRSLQRNNMCVRVEFVFKEEKYFVVVCIFVKDHF